MCENMINGNEQHHTKGKIMNNPAFEKTPDSPETVMASLGITVESVFVPFSQSRDKDKERTTLNWSVTIKRKGHDVLTTDYSAGTAHCPGYKAKTVPRNYTPHGFKTHNGKPYKGSTCAYRMAAPGEALAQYRDALTRAECETGFQMRLGKWGQNPSFETIGGRPGSRSKNKRIEPNPVDVLYSLVTDSDVLDAGGFEEWAGNFGYDTDSRSAESTYHACLEIALKMRAAFGDSGLALLRETFQDY